MNLDRFDWMRMAEQQWMTNAQDGYIVVDGEADDTYCLTVGSLVEKWISIPDIRPVDIIVSVRDCQSGGPGSFMLGRRLGELGCRTEVVFAAGSAGLFIFMGGDERVASRNARFTVHGNLYRWMQSGASDEQRAGWFASRTRKSYDWWFEQCKINGVLEFGVDEALEWGIITDVRS